MMSKCSPIALVWVVGILLWPSFPAVCVCVCHRCSIIKCILVFRCKWVFGSICCALFIVQQKGKQLMSNWLKEKNSRGAIFEQQPKVRATRRRIFTEFGLWLYFLAGLIWVINAWLLITHILWGETRGGGVECGKNSPQTMMNKRFNRFPRIQPALCVPITIKTCNKQTIRPCPQVQALVHIRWHFVANTCSIPAKKRNPPPLCPSKYTASPVMPSDDEKRPFDPGRKKCPSWRRIVHVHHSI